jgi:hypothetical protein
VNLIALWIGILLTSALETGIFLLLLHKIAVLPNLFLYNPLVSWLVLDILILRLILGGFVLFEKDRRPGKILLSLGCILVGTPFGLIALYRKGKR